MRRTRSTASPVGIPAAVTNNGPGSAPGPHRVGSRAEPGLSHPRITGDAGHGVRMRTQAGPAAGIQIGVATGGQQAQPAHPVRDRAQQRKLARQNSPGR